MDRHDARRSASSPQELAPSLHLHWVRHLPPLTPAWPDQPLMQFDAAYSPVVLGNTLFVGSSRDDSVTALDTDTGAERWKFFTDGPVRFAPAAWEGRVYAASDDGYLYCLDAARGTLLWKFRGGPSDRKVLGNGRLISTWPARGGPVVADGKVYFAAGIWPFMGIFLHALDARSGEVVRTNDGDGSLYMQQPHHADAFGGVAPQGALVVAGERLLVPGGRSVPACYDRATGKLLHYRLADNSKTGGGADVAACGSAFFNGGAVFDQLTGDHLDDCGKLVVVEDAMLWTYRGGVCRAWALPASGKVIQTHDRKGNVVQGAAWTMAAAGEAPLPGVEALIKAGSRLYAGAPGRVAALQLPLQEGNNPPCWEAPINGTPARLLAAADRLFVVTREGRLYCFGDRPRQVQVHPLPAAPPAKADAWTEKARSLLDATGVREGYCVVWGATGGRLVTELARQSRLQIVAVEPDPVNVEALRRELAAAGAYGERVAVHSGDAATFPLPPYLASLMVATAFDAADEAGLRKVYSALRPYGGVACLPAVGANRQAVARLVNGGGLVQAHLREAGDWLLLAREGALPGAANWTHEHADAANTRVSRDKLVKAPLGVLWWGGPSHDGILPRHGHGPQPQVIDGRLIVEGVHMLRALDIYTGRLLWEAELPGVGKVYDNTAHQPGANATGANYVSAADGIYVAYRQVCVRLDPATGKQIGAFKLPALSDDKEALLWGHVNVSGASLVAGAEPASEDSKGTGLSSSKHLVVLDRHSGRVLWTATARSGFRHNALCIGGGRLYAIDRPSDDHLARLKRRGEVAAAKARLLALDLATGREVWSTEEGVFGTWLSYSERYDVLVEAGRVARDTLGDEPRGVRALRADRGTVLWHDKAQSGPAMIHSHTILRDRGACDLLTGAPRLRSDPLTGQPVEWTWSRGYGCNTPMASEHLLTFRSGAAGYFDLCGDGGTGNFGGFRSSCTNNLVVAGGVLTAPDYTRTCTCSYQNQTSIGLVHMPEAEMWTFTTSHTVSGPVKRAGINFGAPGARKSAAGTLWLDYPHVGGPSPTVPVRVAPENVEWFRRHSSRALGALPWVGASGGKGIASVTVTLDSAPGPDRVYTVRLHFAEPERLKAGERVFAVAVQGKEEIKALDIVAEAGGVGRTLVKEFRGVRVHGELTVTLTPSAAARVRETVLCGIEVVAEGW
jgi:outer membrane protein assembly factor BamB